MRRIAQAFARAHAENRTALVIYLCAGYPKREITVDLVVAAAEAGADVVEIGMPFSDPTADGPTIQRASEVALRNGMTMRGLLGIAREVRSRSDVPLLLFGYYNPIVTYGEEQLIADAKTAGIDGFLVVDLPPEEATSLRSHLLAHEMDFVPLVAPTSTDARIELAADAATSFLYYVSMTGVTGSASTQLREAGLRAAALRQRTGKPIAVGFGIGNRDDVRVVGAHADGAVVGSAILRAIHGSPDDDAVEAVRALVAELRAGTTRT